MSTNLDPPPAPPELTWRWPAYGAWWWAAAFAALSLAWAAGLKTGLHPLEEVGGDQATTFAVANLGAAVLKLVAGLIALATVQAWGRRVPRWMLLAGGGVTAAVCLGHAILNYGGTILIAAGILHIDGPLLTRYRWLDLILWEPVWLVGGILFTLATWSVWHRRKARGHPDA